MKHKLIHQKKRLEEIVKKKNLTAHQAAAVEEARKHLVQVTRILKELGH
jgi:hypothetical protein